MSKVKIFLKKYWRELIVVAMFFILQSGINDSKDMAFRAYDYAADAARYARYASDDAADASSYASEAADNASYCTYSF